MTKSNSILRIIGGQWRGRKLSFTAIDGLRPTGDRVRETLFNWLMYKTAGARCLDAYAGSGALGLEALSRGADHCLFIERDRKTALQIKQHLATLNCKTAEVVNVETQSWLTKSQPANKFDLVFIDPPFHKGLVEPTLAALTEQMLNPHAHLYIEAERDLKLSIPAHFEVKKHKQSGMVQSWLLQYQQP